MKASAITGRVFAKHDMEGGAERGARLRQALEGLPPDIPVRPPVAIDPAEIELVHDPAYVRWIREMGRGCCFLDDNTYITPSTLDVALMAAGSAAAAAMRALDGENCFALVRPPGHHAGLARQMGFCIFNNAAFAAAKALQSVDRVAVLDWDLHHGNGTQEIFFGSDRVLYLSVHQRGGFPGTGWPEEVGAGTGRGFTLNAPIAPGGEIADYAFLFTEVFLPAIRAHRPELLIISAGQDALADDPHGKMRLAPDDYGLLTDLVLSLDLPTALVLEGGYGPSHGKAIAAIFAALRGKRFGEETAPPRPGTVSLVSTLRKLRMY